MIAKGRIDQGRNNNFDLIRFVAATMVILSHSFGLTGNFYTGPYARVVKYLDPGALGVMIFFSISGHLIIKSLLRQPSLNSFIWARILRIFPGLFAAAVFCAFVIGPLCTSLPLGDYFSSSAVYEFVVHNATLQNYMDSLPGVFTTNPYYTSSVNSPMWTLPGELFLYLCTVCAGVVILIYNRLSKKLIRALPALICVAIYFAFATYSIDYLKIIFYWALLFGAGGMFYILRNKVTISIRWCLGVWAVYFLLSLFKQELMASSAIAFYAYTLALDAVLVYVLMVIAYHPKLQVRSFHKTGDFSYGLYIYAFPIQQLLIAKFHIMNPFIHFLISYPIALIVAVFSWYFIEKPALKLKTFTLHKPA